MKNTYENRISCVVSERGMLQICAPVNLNVHVQLYRHNRNLTVYLFPDAIILLHYVSTIAMRREMSFSGEETLRLMSDTGSAEQQLMSLYTAVLKGDACSE